MKRHCGDDMACVWEQEEEVYEYRVEQLAVPSSLTWRRRILTTQQVAGSGLQFFRDHLQATEE
jgi:hypothetical protein